MHEPSKSPQALTGRLNHLIEKHMEPLCTAGVFVTSVFFCWLLTLVFPYGFFNEETRTYRWVAEGFRWFGPNALDWCATIPFGLVLSLSTKFANPSLAVYWLNAGIFSINIALVFVLGRSLFNSYRAGFFLAFGELLFEIATMRLFYSNLQMCADPLLSELICLGALAALVAWLRRWPFLFVAGYAIMGLGTFVKPVGISVLPLWSIFAFLAWRRNPGQVNKNYAIIAASIIFLAAPLGLWSLRNWLVYGCLKSSALGGSSLLRVSFPLVRDNDWLFDDHKQNQAFIATLRACEQEAKISRSEDLTPLARSERNEEYFIYGIAKKQPFVFLADIVHPNWSGKRKVINTLEGVLLFKLDAISYQLALRIVGAHPVGYLKRTVREYVDMFNPLVMPVNPWDFFGGDPVVCYKYWKPKVGPCFVDFGLYPHMGWPNVLSSNRGVHAVFMAVYNNLLVEQLRNFCFSFQLVLTHLIVLGAAICYLCARTRRWQFLDQATVGKVTVVLAMLFFTTVSNYVVVSMCQVAKMRYALVGEMELHLVLCIAILVAVKGIASMRASFKLVKLADLSQRQAPLFEKLQRK